MAEIYHKRGDTFTYYARWTQGDSDIPVDLTGLTITSQVRAGSFVDDLTITVTNAENGEFIISATAASTMLWPITDSPSSRLFGSRLFSDIQFTDGANTVSTETFQILLREDITR